MDAGRLGSCRQTSGRACPGLGGDHGRAACALRKTFHNISDHLTTARAVPAPLRACSQARLPYAAPALLVGICPQMGAGAKFTGIGRFLGAAYTLAPLCSGITNAVLETDSLYLRDRSGKLHLLRPLLQYLECPECHQMSTFYLDSYKGGNTVTVKSIERSSSREEEIADLFRFVGLLST